MYASLQDGEGSDGGKVVSFTPIVPCEAKPLQSRKLRNKDVPSSGGSTDPEIPELAANIRDVNEKVRRREHERYLCPGKKRKGHKEVMTELGYDLNLLTKTALISKIETLHRELDELDFVWYDFMAAYDNLRLLCEKRGVQIKKMRRSKIEQNLELKELKDERDEWREIAERYIDEGSESDSEAEEMVEKLVDEPVKDHPTEEGEKEKPTEFPKTKIQPYSWAPCSKCGSMCPNGWVEVPYNSISFNMGPQWAQHPDYKLYSMSITSPDWKHHHGVRPDEGAINNP